MPNGHSGSFVIKTTDLKQLVQAVSGDAVVGKSTTGSRLEALAQRTCPCPYECCCRRERRCTAGFVSVDRPSSTHDVPS